MNAKEARNLQQDAPLIKAEEITETLVRPAAARGDDHCFVERRTLTTDVADVIIGWGYWVSDHEAPPGYVGIYWNE